MKLYANLGALIALINERLSPVPAAGSFCDSPLIFRHFGIMISGMRRNRLRVLGFSFLRKRRFPLFGADTPLRGVSALYTKLCGVAAEPPFRVF